MFNSINQRKLMCVAIAGALASLAMSASAQETARDSAHSADGQTPKNASDNGNATPPAAANGSKTSTSTAKQGNTDVVQEVIVTATRHSTSLLKTPVAVTAVTQEELTRDGITDVRGLSGEIPNLQIGTAADGSSGVQIAIRGVSNNDFTEVGNPAVGLHINGLYSPRPQGALALMFDLDQVEVLRGPQGTLFGRNSTGGSINIIAAKPEIGSTFGSYEQEVGNYNHLQESIIQNIPVGDSLALRFTGMKTQRDSYINQTQDTYTVNLPALGFPSMGVPSTDQRHDTHVFADKAYMNKDEWAGRLTALWKITPNLKTLASFENFQNSDAGDIALKDCEQAQNTPFACTAAHPQFSASINLPGVTNMSIRTIRSDTTWAVDQHTDIEYNISRAVERRYAQQDSDSGYQPLPFQVTANPSNPGGTWPVYDNQTYTLDSKYASTTQELQLRQNYDNLRTVIGAFGMSERNSIDFGQDFLNGSYPYSNFYHQPDRASVAKAVFAQSDWTFVPKWTLTTGVRFTRDSRADTGGEYFSDFNNQYFNGITNPPGPGTAGFNIFNSSNYLPGMGAAYGTSAFNGAAVISNNSQSWSKTTGRLGLMYQATPTDMFYTSLSSGYKAGGFNDLTNLCGTALDPQGNPYNCLSGPPGPHYSFLPYKPETVVNLEAGYKGKMLDNRLTFSATVFYERYTNMQVTGQHTIGESDQPCPSNNPTCNAVISWYSTANVAQADLSGLEIEGQYRPWKGGRLAYAGSLLHAVVGSYPTFSDDQGCAERQLAGVTPCAPVYTGSDPALSELRPYNVKGNRLPYAPDETINVSFSQEFSMPGDYTIVPWIMARWQSKEFFTLRNLESSTMSDEQKAYASVDLALRLNSPTNKWHMEAYVKNATNTLSKTWSGYGGPNQSFVVATYNDPRMYGVRFGAEW